MSGSPPVNDNQQEFVIAIPIQRAHQNQMAGWNPLQPLVNHLHDFFNLPPWPLRSPLRAFGFCVVLWGLYQAANTYHHGVVADSEQVRAAGTNNFYNALGLGFSLIFVEYFFELLQRRFDV